jgi:calcium-independent phospholipase A2-gamma
MTGEAKTIVRFTDYKGPAGQQGIYDDIKIWEAARATSAATTFFAPMTIKSRGIQREFLDGGLGANNPVHELWQEAAKAFGPGPLEPQIQCLLSIGTGKPKLEAFGKSIWAVGQSIINIATETQATANRFESEYEDLFTEDRAFRFNPPDINEVGLEDASKKAIIAVRTEAYCNNPETGRHLTRFKNAVREEQSVLTQALSNVA